MRCQPGKGTLRGALRRDLHAALIIFGPIAIFRVSQKSPRIPCSQAGDCSRILYSLSPDRNGERS